MKPKYALLVLAVAASSSAVFAQNEPPREASIALGYVGTSGNTDTTTFNAELTLTLRSAPWTHNLKLQALGSQENSVTKAERYFLEDKSDYALDDLQYMFAKGSYLDDRFSGYSYQATASLGYGRYLIRNDMFTLEGFGGLGYRQSEEVEGEKIGEGVVSLGEKFAWNISDVTKLVQSLTSDIGEDLTISIFEVGLESQIIGGISTKIAFQARHISEVPEGNKKTDTLTSVSLVYSF